MQKCRWIALIPAYQPDGHLLRLVQELSEEKFEVIVVNDGSALSYDPLFEQVREYGTVLIHEKNKGKGEALKTGYDYIRHSCRGRYVVVTMDADGQHSVADARRVCEEAMRYPDSLVLGCRRFDQREIPLRSRFGNGITRLVYRFATGVRVSDTQTGLRACSDQLISYLFEIPGSRYEYEMNELMQCARDRVAMREVEIETIYMDGNASSHFNTLKDSFLIYKEILKFSASSLICFAIDYGLFCLFSAAFSAAGAALYLTLANIFARVISAAANYTINRKLVFCSSKSAASSALQYFSLAAVILLLNTMLLNLLTGGLGLNRYLAKVLTEMVLFVFSWLMQKNVIFTNGRKTVNET